ncbi:MAG: chemoreceptor glutamine deamidase CheD [Pseudomonadota bacterium]
MHIGVENDGKPINRYWDKSREAFCVKILPGEYYYTTTNEYIATTLGSCIAACIWDEQHKVGGMNHFMLPITDKDKADVTWGSLPTDATRYGNYAMEYLINEILKHGGEKSKFKVKLFGGGKVLEGAGNVGERNAEFALEYVKTEGLKLISQDLCDVYPRKVLFDPLTGKAWMKRIQDKSDGTLAAREREYRRTINTDTISGDVDLF